MNALSPGRRLTGAVVISLMTLGTLNTGCKNALEKDVTNDPKYGDFFAVVGKWKAKTPLKIIEVNKHLHLCPKDSIDYAGDRVVLTLPIGTEIHIDRLIYREVMGGTPSIRWVASSLVPTWENRLNWTTSFSFQIHSMIQT